MTFERTHGGMTGGFAGEVLDFSVSVNPYGPCPAVARAIRDAPLDRYPDPTARTARHALGSAFAADPDEIVLGNGATDLLWSLARVLARPGDPVAIVEPTFSEFRLAVASAGGRPCEWRAGKADGFRIDLDRVDEVLGSERARVLYLCLPNSPTGAALPAEDVAALAAGRPEVAIVLDQSFLSLSDRFADALVPFPPNVTRVRSLTKDHAIPGTRVGYLIGSRETAVRVEAERAAWTTSTAAQAAVLAACGEGAFIEDSRRKLAADRERLGDRLRSLDLDPVSSSAPFVLVEVRSSRELQGRLLERHRILVRDCASFGLPDFIRISARPAADTERLAAALARELG